MGNTFVRSSKGAHDGNTPAPAAPSQPGIPFRPQCQPSGSSGITNHTVDSVKFEPNHPVPKEPSKHATASEKKPQAKWYTNILGWKESPPTTSGKASSLVSHVLEVGTDALTGFMSIMERLNLPEPPSLPEGVKYQLNTLPVKAKLVGDGDGMTVHVSTTDPRESHRVPSDVRQAARERRRARANKDYHRADEIRESMKQLTTDYRFGNEDDLVRVYRIRLRGIDAPEMDQEYGQEAKDALRKLIQEKPLQIHVYESDTYDRLVGDVYCRGVFVQERLLKMGCAWHYEAFDKRPEFSEWQREARSARRGLWANSNPVAPWDFKKRNDPNKKNGRKPCCTGRNSQRDHAFTICAS